MLRLSWLICVFLLLTVLSALCITIHVPNDYPTIQAGIDAATQGDTVLVADGVYSGAGNFNLNFGGQAIVLISESGPDNCIIDAMDMGRCFWFSGETYSPVLSGFTLTNGIGSYYGGNIKIESSRPIIEDCIIRDGYAPG